MDKEERLKKQIKTIYTEIVRRLIDPAFDFPKGGKVERQLSQFIEKFTELCGGEMNESRLVDYCVFQAHKNRQSPYQRTLAPNVFGATAFKKYQSLSSRQKKFVEDRWLSEKGLTRTHLCSLVCNRREHPQAKYIYMEAEERTKKRFHGTEMGFAICSASTLMWSPFSEACQQCENTERCKAETESRYPELYRIRLEEYDKRRQRID